MVDLKEARLQLNEIDNEMKLLFIKRMNIVKEIALYKKNNNLPIFDATRESEMKERLTKDINELKEYYIEFLNVILNESKKYQKNTINL